MSKLQLFRVAGIAFVLFIGATASIAHAQVYKCTDSAGKTTYADAPCDSGTKPLKLPEDTKGNTTNPHMCAQLRDETMRLAAEANQEAKRGRAESADHAKRRQMMNERYAARCVGITRSAPKPQ